jgi:hypothetical protein
VAARGTWGLAGDPLAPFTAGYRPDSGRATVRAAAEREVRGPLLGSLLKNWRQPYDLTGGRLQADVDLTWDPAGGLGGRVGVRVDGAAGFAGATEAGGISADLMLDGDAAGWTLRPTTVRAAVVDPGVPVTDLSLRLGGSGERLTVADAEARLLGGRARLSDVDYAASGDLTLAVQLKGRNPEVESGRPIHYNLTLRENVPVLLESLRLQGRVTEGIERRVTN